MPGACRWGRESLEKLGKTHAHRLRMIIPLDEKLVK